MHRRSLPVVLAAFFVLTVAAACGGSSSPKTGPGSTTSATPAAPPFKATFSAISHRPVVNKNWKITVTATGPTGKPLAATVQLNVLLGSLQVGQVDNGKIHHFVGHYRENITWPAASVGHKLTLQAVIKAGGRTKRLLWAISVVKK